MIRPRKLAAFALALCLPFSAAQAHNAWLVPSSTVLSTPQWITVDAASGTDFIYFNHAPLRLDTLTVTAPDGSALQPDNLNTGKLRSVFDLNLNQPGTYRIAVVNQGISASYKLHGETKRWRGTAATFAQEIPADAQDLQVMESANRLETFATVGKPSVWQASGTGLELLPISHPNDLVAGEPASFRLQIDGKPAAGIEVTVIASATRYRNKLNEIKTTTDQDGKFSITWPSAGLYWLDADAKDNKTSVKQAKERRLAYGATLEVLPQ